MNCERCKKIVKTPRSHYVVSELAEMCRQRCLTCDPDNLPHGAAECTHINGVERWTQTGPKVPAICGRKLPGVAESYMASRTQTENVTPFSEDTEDALREFATTLADLDLEGVKIVWALLRGMTLEQMSQIIGSSGRQATRYRVSRTVASNPWLGRFYRSMIARKLHETNENGGRSDSNAADGKSIIQGARRDCRPVSVRLAKGVNC